MASKQGDLALLQQPAAQALLRAPIPARLAYTWTDGTPRVLLIRGTARLSEVDGVVPEYALSARRYLGEEQGRSWVEQAETLFPKMVRIAIKPEWVAVHDFQERFPSAIESAMGR